MKQATQTSLLATATQTQLETSLLRDRCIGGGQESMFS
jgi:hypothetical protein